MFLDKYEVPGTVLSILLLSTYLVLYEPFKVGITAILVLRMRNRGTEK